jgi:hypothetical protein
MVGKFQIQLILYSANVISGPPVRDGGDCGTLMARGSVRDHDDGSKKLNACILSLSYMVYL